MKPTPMRPVSTPIRRAEGRLLIGDINCVKLPNFRTDALVRVTSVP